MTKELKSPTFFGYQTASQCIGCEPTAMRVDEVLCGGAFALSKSGNSIKVLDCGTVSVDYNVTWEFPNEASTVKYWATLNGDVVPGSTGQTAISGGFTGEATRSKSFAVKVNKDDVIKVFAISSSGKDTTFIPEIPLVSKDSSHSSSSSKKTTKCGGGGFSIRICGC